AGPPRGTAVVFHHGTPFSAVPYGVAADGVSSRGARLVSWSRPGYAGSTRRPGRRVADVAADTDDVLDALGHDRFVTIGWSGGGPHALACAALMPGRCQAAALIAGVAPFRAEGIDWLDGMGPENIEEFALAVEGGQPFSDFLRTQAAQFASLTGPDVAASLGGLVSEVDRRALTGDFADFMARAIVAAVSVGTDGWHDDDMAFIGDWGFDLSHIECPVAVWQGQQDRMVPFAHGVWLAAHVPGARPHLLPDEGHVSLAVGIFGHILDDLLALAR
ncbi:MAG TPA: alpha/beta fold hydrolase, partial [Acidimicrobiales bacterium]|nr:alpha/beta fold hydrolase [Acidimicrobiales bacterium]